MNEQEGRADFNMEKAIKRSGAVDDKDLDSSEHKWLFIVRVDDDAFILTSGSVANLLKNGDRLEWLEDDKGRYRYTKIQRGDVVLFEEERLTDAGYAYAKSVGLVE